MALNRINGFVPGYSAYNIPSAPDANKVAAAASAASAANAGVDQTPDQSPRQEDNKKKMDLTIEVPARENASIENIAISFGQYDSSSIDLFGDMGLASADMKQAITGMKKDHILHEYQYFVGGKDLTGKESNIIAGTEDGLVVKLR